MSDRVRSISFSPHEKDLLEHFDKQGNGSKYVKRLIRHDIGTETVEDKVQKLLDYIEKQKTD